jgi:hypothetical protein
MIPWYQDDAKAKSLMEMGWEGQRRVIARLATVGVDSRLDREPSFRKHITQRAEYKNDRDVLIPIPGATIPLWVEVKSWKYRFGDDPSSYPEHVEGFARNCVHFETIRRRETRGYDPVAWVLLSRPTNGILAIPATERYDFFTSGLVYDKNRGIEDDWWCCWKHKLRSFNWLVQALGGGNGNI